MRYPPDVKAVLWVLAVIAAGSLLSKLDLGRFDADWATFFLGTIVLIGCGIWVRLLMLHETFDELRKTSEKIYGAAYLSCPAREILGSYPSWIEEEAMSRFGHSAPEVALALWLQKYQNDHSLLDSLERMRIKAEIKQMEEKGDEHGAKVKREALRRLFGEEGEEQRRER